jgi:hypothetical protein
MIQWRKLWYPGSTWSQHRRGEDTILTSLYLTYRSGKLPHTSSLMIKQAGI